VKQLDIHFTSDNSRYIKCRKVIEVYAACPSTLTPHSYGLLHLHMLLRAFLFLLTTKANGNIQCTVNRYVAHIGDAFYCSTPITMITCFNFQDFQFQIPQMGKVHPDHLASKALRSVLPHDTFIMSPLLEGKWIKISGRDGFVGPDWRDAEDAEIVKLTSTLDAFQHFLVEGSDNGLIIYRLPRYVCLTAVFFMILQPALSQGYFHKKLLQDSRS
jgi:hypothetical protein